MTQRLGGHREQFVLCFKSRGQQVKGCWGWCVLMGPVGGSGAGRVLQVCRGWALPLPLPRAALQAPQRAAEERGPAGKKIPLSLSRNFLFLPGPQLQEPIKPRCTAGNYRLPETQDREAGYAGGGWGAAGRQEPSCQPGCQGGRVHTRCPIKLP